mmetsp:Transcript_11168/g.36889  ORF Transcript_11168/g.36889 Transcript_11168/m.36889 type:complete len:207 (+) Transcript_11168:3815-4435(+)
MLGFLATLVAATIVLVRRPVETGTVRLARTGRAPTKEEALMANIVGRRGGAKSGVLPRRRDATTCPEFSGREESGKQTFRAVSQAVVSVYLSLPGSILYPQNPFFSSFAFAGTTTPHAHAQSPTVSVVRSLKVLGVFMSANRNACARFALSSRFRTPRPFDPFSCGCRFSICVEKCSFNNSCAPSPSSNRCGSSKEPAMAISSPAS